MGDILPRLMLFLEGGWRRRYLIAVPILLMPIAGAMVGVLSPKRYSAHTSMLVQETAKLNPFLEDLAVSANLEGRMEALKTLLHSRHILSQVALSQQLFEEQDAAARKDAVIAQLSSALSVVKLGKDVIRIDYVSGSPEGMASLLSAVSEQFIEQLLAPERSSIRESERFLKHHLLLSRNALEQAEEALAQFRSRNADGLPELHTANTERLSRIRQTLVEREAELAGAKQSLGSLDEQLSSTDPVLQRIETELIEYRAELTALMSRYTEGHSKVQGIQRIVRRLEQERSAVLQKTTQQSIQALQASALKNDTPFASQRSADGMLVMQFEAMQQAQLHVASLEQEVETLRSMAQTLERQISVVGQQEQEHTALQRDLKVKRALYEDLLTRYEMAQVTGALGLFEQADRIKIIDRPYTPSAPSNFPLWLFVCAGLIGGLLLGLGLALFAELADPTLRTAAAVAAVTGLPVLTRIPPLKESPR